MLAARATAPRVASVGGLLPPVVLLVRPPEVLCNKQLVLSDEYHLLGEDQRGVGGGTIGGVGVFDEERPQIDTVYRWVRLETLICGATELEQVSRCQARIATAQPTGTQTRNEYSVVWAHRCLLSDRLGRWGAA